MTVALVLLVWTLLSLLALQTLRLHKCATQWRCLSCGQVFDRRDPLSSPREHFRRYHDKGGDDDWR